MYAVEMGYKVLSKLGVAAPVIPVGINWDEIIKNEYRQCEKEAEKGSAIASKKLGDFYEHGKNGVEKNFVTAAKHYQQALERGHTEAQANLTQLLNRSDLSNNDLFGIGLFYEYGTGVKQDYVKAKLWYEKATTKGGGIEHKKLGRFYENGQAGVEKNFVTAAKYYQQAIDNGYAEAQAELTRLLNRSELLPAELNNIGRLYESDPGVKRNFVTAAKCYQQALEKGHTESVVDLIRLLNCSDLSNNNLFNIGLFYEYGVGVKQDYVKAKLWYEKATEKGGGIEHKKLGGFYEHGKPGIEKDFVTAAKYYQQAIDSGYAEAQVDLALILNHSAFSGNDLFKLGRFYYHGAGVKQDYIKARVMYEKAAEKGCSGVYRELGFFYEYGLGGVKKNFEIAAEYYLQAINRNVGARADLIRLMQTPAVTVEPSTNSARTLGVFVGAAQIAAGTYLVVVTGGLLAPVGSALISSGANGCIYSVTAENEDLAVREFLKTSAIGAATGLVSTGVGAGVSAGAGAIGAKFAGKAVEEVGKEVIKQTGKEIVFAVGKKMATDAVAGAATTLASAHVEYHITTAMNGGDEEKNKKALEDLNRKCTRENIMLGGVTNAVGGQINAATTKVAKTGAKTVINKVVGDKAVIKEVVGKTGKKILDVAVGAGVGATAGGVTSASTHMMVNAYHGNELTQDMGPNVALGTYMGAVNGGLTKVKKQRDKQDIKNKEACEKKDQKDELNKMREKTLNGASMEDLEKISIREEELLDVLKIAHDQKLQSLKDMQTELERAAGDPKRQERLQRRVARKQAKLSTAEENYKEAQAIHGKTKEIILDRQQLVSTFHELTRQNTELENLRREQESLLNKSHDNQRDVDTARAKAEELEVKYEEGKNKKSQLESESSHLNAQVSDTEAKLQEQKTYLSSLETEQARLDEENHQIRREISEAESKFSGAKHQIEGLEREFEGASIKIDKSDCEIEKGRTKFTNLLEECDGKKNNFQLDGLESASYLSDKLGQFGNFLGDIVSNPGKALDDIKKSLMKARSDADRFLVELDEAKDKLAKNTEKSVNKRIDEAKAEIAKAEDELLRLKSEIANKAAELNAHVCNVCEPLENFRRHAEEELKNASEALAEAEKKVRDYTSDILKPLEEGTAKTFKNIEKAIVKAGDDVSAEWKRLPPGVQVAIVGVAAGVLAYGAVTVFLAGGGEIALGVQIGEAFVPIAKVSGAGVVGIATPPALVAAGLPKFFTPSGNANSVAGSNLGMEITPPKNSSQNPPKDLSLPHSQPEKNPPLKPQAKPSPTQSSKPTASEDPQPQAEEKSPAASAEIKPSETKESPPTSSNKKVVVGDEAYPEPKPPLSDLKDPASTLKSNRQKKAEQRRLEKKAKRDAGVIRGGGANTFFRPNATQKSTMPHRPFPALHRPGLKAVPDIIGLANELGNFKRNIEGAKCDLEDRHYVAKFDGCDKPTISTVDDDPGRRCARQKAEEDRARRKEEMEETQEQLNKLFPHRYGVSK